MASLSVPTVSSLEDIFTVFVDIYKIIYILIATWLLPQASEVWGWYCFHRCVSVHTRGGTPSLSHNFHWSHLLSSRRGTQVTGLRSLLEGIPVTGPRSLLEGYPSVRSQVPSGGTPVTGPRSLPGGTPVLSWLGGTPVLARGYPSPGLLTHTCMLLVALLLR